MEDYPLSFNILFSSQSYTVRNMPLVGYLVFIKLSIEGKATLSILMLSNHPGLSVLYFTFETPTLPAHLTLINGSQPPVSSAGGKPLA